MHDVTIRIEKMTFGGSGLGHADGKVCFVPFAAPGDLARVRVRTEKRSYMEGSLIELPEPSPSRVEPPCPVFGICGGCNWQHLPYEVQLEEKRKIFAEIMWRSARVDSDHILPVIPAPGPYGYRARIQLKVRSVHGEPHVGFYRNGSHFVVAVPGSCAIAHPAINRMLPEIHQLMRLFTEPDKIPQIDIAAGDDSATSAVFHYVGTDPKAAAAFFKDHRHLLPSCAGTFLQSGRKSSLQKIWGTDTLSYRIPKESLTGIPEQNLSFASGGFSQINYSQNRALITAVLASLDLTGDERVLDIYCGNGNFSLPLASMCREVVGIEEYGPSITDALRNARENCLDNVRFRSVDAVAGVKDIAAAGDRFDVVLLDPPRTGAAELVRLIPEINPAKIVYVSCNPSTLARDIGILRGYGYSVASSQPVDMFPQTYHIESVTLLVHVSNGSPSRIQEKP
jgi:23S rRNA (uracil1939-C5)-methyltransferase